MKKQELSDQGKYHIYCQGRKIYSDLSEESMFEVIDELSQQYSESGTPHPDDIMVEFDSNHME